MRRLRIHLSAIAAFSFLLFSLFLSCAGTQKSIEQDYICREHGVHHFNNKEEFCACFGIDISAVSNYYVFSKETKLSGDEKEAAASIKDAVADDIVDIIVKRLDAAFGSDVFSRWQFEKIDIPVTFRSFKKKAPDGSYIKSTAISLKANFTPRALIKFLPLEYKMKLLKPVDQYKDDITPLK
jgi:hypothetical protein